MPCHRQMLDVPPAETPKLVAIRMLHKNPAVGSTREGK